MTEPGSSYDSLVSYTGNRHEEDQRIQQLCDTVDTLKCRDLNDVAIAVSKQRADNVSVNDVMAGSGLHASSDVDQRTFHAIDSLLYETFPDTPFIELSPVQPFGLNTVLAGLSESKILATTRRAEVNADISTALVREAVARDPDLLGGVQKLAANTRILRTQKFDPTSKFLPHFRMFGQATVGRAPDGTAQQSHLIGHLTSELVFLRSFSAAKLSRLGNVAVELGDVRIMDSLVSSGRVALEAIKRNTTNPHYRVFEAASVDIPETVAADDTRLPEILGELGLAHVSKDVAAMRDAIVETGLVAADSCSIRLDRFAGHNYYLGSCYNIFGTNTDGATLPLADGGYTNWAQKLTRNRRSFSVSSGIGTELLARYFTS